MAPASSYVRDFHSKYGSLCDREELYSRYRRHIDRVTCAHWFEAFLDVTFAANERSISLD